MSTPYDKKEATKQSRRQYGEGSREETSRTFHGARNDYQDAGEPFGSLSNRDRSKKR